MGNVHTKMAPLGDAFGATSKSSQHTMQNMKSSEQSALFQPHDRLDSDEIELKDSDIDEEVSEDDCEFNSLEGNTRPQESRLPKTQPKFN